LIELLQKHCEQLVRKETPIGDDSCYLSHNCPYAKAASLAMASHSSFCLQALMHSNTWNFLIKFVGRMRFGVQTETKPLIP